MLKRLAMCLLLLAAFACSNNADVNRYAALNSLNDAEQEKFIYEIIRYMGKLAPQADHLNKLEDRFDEAYRSIASDHRLDLFHTDDATGFTFFLASRIAPSLHVRRIGIGGRMSVNESGEITHYEELFRTWRMPDKDLFEKGGMLFMKMINNEDLSPYYPENSGKEEYIEFPNSDTYFDTDERVWVSRLMNPKEVFYHALTTSNAEL